jgi:uncharacterized protein
VTDERREHLTWETFGVAARELAQLVADDGFAPTCLLTIARGGLALGGAMSYALGAKNCCVINVEYYTGVDERLEVPIILPPALAVADLQDARLLVVDDVADTGGTLRLVVETIRAHVAELRTAVLYEKPRSLVRCNYVWRRTDRWIEFPWSSLPSVRRGTVGGGVGMDDHDLVGRIGRLVDEEHDLEKHLTSGGPSEEDRERLRQLEVQLDQCWDLLRQRRGRRDAGEDPDRATARPESTVEGYKQ